MSRGRHCGCWNDSPDGNWPDKCPAVALDAQSCEGPIGTLVADFDQYLTKVCGLSPATRFYRRRYAREFLEWRFEGKRWNLTKLCFADFVDYVKFRARGSSRLAHG